MKNIKTKIALVLLWVAVLFNMLFADVFSVMVEFVQGGVIDIPGDVEIIMAIAGILTNIPILMVVLSWVLPYKTNRIVNIIASVLTIIYVVGGYAPLLHYYIIASVEVILLLVIIFTAKKWNEKR